MEMANDENERSAMKWIKSKDGERKYPSLLFTSNWLRDLESEIWVED